MLETITPMMALLSFQILWGCSGIAERDLGAAMIQNTNHAKEYMKMASNYVVSSVSYQREGRYYSTGPPKRLDCNTCDQKYKRK